MDAHPIAHPFEARVFQNLAATPTHKLGHRHQCRRKVQMCQMITFLGHPAPSPRIPWTKLAAEVESASSC